MNKPWWDARDYCRYQHGSQLLTIDSQHMETEIEGMAKLMNKSLWIGYNNVYNTKWQWIDESESNHTFWADIAYKNGDVEGKNCAMISENGWYPSYCSKSRYFICGDRDVSNIRTIGNITFQLNGTNDDIAYYHDMVNKLNRSALNCQSMIKNMDIVSHELQLQISCDFQGIDKQIVIREHMNDNSTVSGHWIHTNPYYSSPAVIIYVICTVCICCACCYIFSKLCKNYGSHDVDFHKTNGSRKLHSNHGYDGYEAAQPPPAQLRMLSSKSHISDATDVNVDDGVNVDDDVTVDDDNDEKDNVDDMSIALEKPLPPKLSCINEDKAQTVDDKDIGDKEVIDEDSDDESAEEMYKHQRAPTNSSDRDFQGEHFQIILPQMGKTFID